MRQNTLAEAGFERYGKQTRRERFLEEMKAGGAVGSASGPPPTAQFPGLSVQQREDLTRDFLGSR